MSYTASPGHTGTSTGTTDLQKAATAVAAVFTLVGILGFVPGITSGIYPIDMAGHESDAKLLGIFQVSVLHNLVHLLFGLVGFALARTFSGAKNYLIGGGIVYAIVWIYGLVVGHDSAANFLPLNSADNWLHFVLAVGMIALGVLLSKRDSHHTA